MVYGIWYMYVCMYACRSTKGNHPWDFSYNREPASHTRPTTPYWRVASQLKVHTTLHPTPNYHNWLLHIFTDINDLHIHNYFLIYLFNLKPPEFSLSSSVGSLKQTNFSKSKSSGNLNDFDREAILNKYDAKVINVCRCRIIYLHNIIIPLKRSLIF